VLGTRPGHLLETHPSDLSADLMEIWADIPPERREQARDVLIAFRAKRAPERISDQPSAAKSKR
ncbi:MAG: hypothetical protein JOZ27_09000, partial [Caulobacteraceae bacterium]|nr:hypothetical protein [Caulobacteraceae bacterium]